MTKGRLEAFSDGVIAIIIQATSHVNGRVLWANLHLLFWLSLTPFVTAWVSVVLYAVGILLARWTPAGSCVLYILVVIVWLVPDPRLERTLADRPA